MTLHGGLMAKKRGCWLRSRDSDEDGVQFLLSRQSAYAPLGDLGDLAGRTVLIGTIH